MSTNRSMSMRVAAAAGSLALTLSIVGAPAVMAQDDGPEATVVGLLGALEAKELEAFPTFFCPEFAGDMGGLDFASITEGMPPGLDVDVLLNAFTIVAQINSLEVLSQTDSEAIVEFDGSIAMGLNPDEMGPFVEALLGTLGEEVTPDMVEMFTGLAMAEFESESMDISAEITLVPGETMPWLICSDLAGLDGADGEDMADDSGAAEATATEGE